MDTPERIYLQHVEDGKLWPAWFIAKILNDDIEYIRTDIFIEKACEWLQNHIVGYNIFIEDFKQAMDINRISI